MITRTVDCEYFQIELNSYYYGISGMDYDKYNERMNSPELWLWAMAGDTKWLVSQMITGHEQIEIGYF